MKRVLALLFSVPGIAWAQTATNPSLATQGAATPAPVEAVTASDKWGSPCPYPDKALHAGVLGLTHLVYQQGADGQLTDLLVLKSSGNQELDQSAVNCIRGWHPLNLQTGSPFVGAPVQISISWVIPGLSPGGWSSPAGGYQYTDYTSRRRIGGSTCPDSRVNPQTPTRLDSMQGQTGIRYQIAPDGHVAIAEVETSSGNPDLDQQTLVCVESWRFQAASNDQTPLPVTRSVVFNWRVR